MNNPCTLCGETLHKKLFSVKSFSILKCDTCSLVSAQPVPSKKELDNFYKNFQFGDGFSFEKNLRIDAIRTIKNLKSIGFSKGKLLDIGCGAGFFIDEAKKEGFDVTGVDTAKIPIRYAKRNLKLNVFQKDIMLYKSEIKYDVLCLQQVIEHLPDPYPILSKMKTLVKKNGVICISTPNIDSWLSNVLREKFNYLIPPEHLFYYSPTTLKMLLEKTGFRIIRTTTYGYPMDFGGIYRFLRGEKKDKKITMPTKKITIQKTATENQSLKQKFFENYICNYGYPLLNLFNKGSMIEIYAKTK